MTEKLDIVIDGYLEASPESRCFWWEGEWYNQAYLKNMADVCAETLRAAGFSEGQRIAVLMPNSPMIIALSLAVWRLGGAICPLNAKSGISSLVATLSLLDPFAVVLSNEVQKEIVSELDAGKWAHVTCLSAGPLPEFQGRAGSAESSEIAVIFSTSGTTGTPKAVPLSHANFLNNCLKSIQALENLNEGDILLNVLPSFHAFGFMAGSILPLVLKGAQAIIPNFLPPSRTLESIKAASVNVVLLVPMMLNFLLGLIEKGARPPEGIKLLIIGGDRYNIQMEERVKRLMGVGVIEGYGLTECSPVVSFNRSYARRKLGTVGEFLEGYEWQLRAENGTLLPHATEGVLWLRGPSVIKWYFRAPEINNERFDDGWFNTGDYLHIEDGYIRILDRVTDIIIVSGFNVYPQEVEAVLEEHPAVQAAVVIGIPNANSGEVPKAYIQKRAGAETTESEIFHYCKERLSHYKVPRKVDFVESLPLSGIGKVLRRVLRDQERAKNTRPVTG